MLMVAGIDSKGEVGEGTTICEYGCTWLPPVPATHEQRWLIFPNGEKYVHLLFLHLLPPCFFKYI